MDPTLRVAALMGNVDELQRVCKQLQHLLDRIPGDVRERLCQVLSRGLRHVAIQLDVLQRAFMEQRH